VHVLPDKLVLGSPNTASCCCECDECVHHLLQAAWRLPLARPFPLIIKLHHGGQPEDLAATPSAAARLYAAVFR
jgi:hypothetical protein